MDPQAFRNRDHGYGARIGLATGEVGQNGFDGVATGGTRVCALSQPDNGGF